MRTGILMALLAPAGPAAALTLQEALQHGVEQQSLVAQRRAVINAARARVSHVRANYGPKVRVEASAILWDSEQTLALGGGGGGETLPPAQTPYEEAFAGLLQSSGPITVREQLTTSATLKVIQPLSGLYAISVAEDLANLGVDASKISLETAKRQVEGLVVEAYLRVLQAEAALGATDEGVKALESQAKRVRALVDNGVLGRNELLRIEVATQAARRERLRAEGFSDEDIGRIRGPVGLDIGAETAAEIALSIVGEVVQIKRPRSR